MILSKDQVRSVISMGDCINAVEGAFRELALGTATMPARVSLQIRGQSGWFAVMPAYLAGTGSLSSKIVTVYPNNEPVHRIPNVLATIIVNDVQTGRVEAIMEGSYITAMRTGAVSGVATKYLARKDSEVVGIFGAGVQAAKQLEAVCEVRGIRKAVVYDTDENRTQNYIRRVSASSDIEISAANSARELVKASDIIVTATTSQTPVFDGADLNPGTHTNAIGSFTPNSRELDDVTMSSSKVVVDSIDATLAEAGDLIIPLQHGIIHRNDIWAELSEIVTEKKPARTSADEKTVFKSVGLGIQDAAVAKLVFEKARAMRVGTQFDFESSG